MIWIGAILAVLGLIGVLWCLRKAAWLRKARLEDAEIRTEVQRLIFTHMASIGGAFLGLGLLLSLTPCVFPMVPILSGIIVGQRQPLSTARAFGLSLVYVLAMAATYALAGIVAGLAGHNLQAAFQHPAVIVAFAAALVAST